MRESLEQRFHVPLDHIQLHFDTQARNTNMLLAAKACAIDNHIGLRGREWLTGPNGAQLLAHEVSHTLSGRSHTLYRSTIESPGSGDSEQTTAERQIRAELIARAAAKSQLRPDVVADALAAPGPLPQSVMMFIMFNTAIRDILAAKEDEKENLLENVSARLASTLRREFIFSSQRSIFELFPADKEAKWEGMVWEGDDYPGGNVGPHENSAKAQFGEFEEILPERRPNQDPHLKKKQQEFESKLKLVPGNARKEKLHPEAVDAFVKMRVAAAMDGIPLQIRDGFRSVAQSKKSFEKNPNPSALAKGLSSHNLGLAIDVTLSFGNQQFVEISTNMANVNAMRSSPIYKWLALNAERFGWYPWNNEPWHWEYFPKAWDENPP